MPHTVDFALYWHLSKSPKRNNFVCRCRCYNLLHYRRFDAHHIINRLLGDIYRQQYDNR